MVVSHLHSFCVEDGLRVKYSGCYYTGRCVNLTVIEIEDIQIQIILSENFGMKPDYLKQVQYFMIKEQMNCRVPVWHQLKEVVIEDSNVVPGFLSRQPNLGNTFAPALQSILCKITAENIERNIVNSSAQHRSLAVYYVYKNKHSQHVAYHCANQNNCLSSDTRLQVVRSVTSF